jgi:hypothetical protein
VPLTTHNAGVLVTPADSSHREGTNPMAAKEVFVEIKKACWIAGVQQGVGSIVKMKENDANLCKGLGRGVIVNAKEEKHVPFTKKSAVEAKAAK